MAQVCSLCGKRLSILFVYLNPFLDRLTEFAIHLGLVVSVNATEHKTRTRSDVALVLFRPFNNLEVSVSRFHSVTSRTAFSTSRS